ncbi:GGDEF domain-containing protein [Amphritea opalescens]|uniref:GGDEF domain-containing protein n=1 Tax=Amphritea opalescens TaxID=2490544 RepID=A0A430KVE4_9GAMM|nr:sensor domain-containing diguanylate cyclase [Amphritea opalescens]RTE67436.1 GGDEF domain-containing protein [Amphritea opalescens]
MLARLLLFIILITADMLTIYGMQALDIAISFFWLETFLNATIMALATILAVRVLIHFQQLKPSVGLNAESLLLRSGLIAFAVETVLSLSLPLLKLSSAGFPTGITCGLLFALLTTVLIHYLLLQTSEITEVNHRSLIEKVLALRGVLLLAYLFSLSLFLLLLLNIYQQQHLTNIKQSITQEQQQLTLIRNGLNDHIDKAALDTRMLALQDNLQHLLIGDDPDAATRLAHDYLSLATIKPSYEQIRFIDEKGIERIRVDQGRLGPVVTQPNRMQDKHQRYYFTDAFKLSPGQVYISRMDLNIENGRIELPFKPIVRLATPVFDQQGEKRGIVIINLNSSALFSQLKHEAKNITGELMLLNDEGYWLFGRERDAAWAFMFPRYKDRTIDKYYPGIWPTIKTDQQGYITSPAGYFIFETISISHNDILDTVQTRSPSEPHRHEWKLISLASDADFSAAYRNMLPPLIMFFILTSIITGVGTLLYFRIQRKHLTAQQKIEQLAHFDQLTGLYNRNLFIELLELQLAQSRRKKEPLAVIYMDLDHFKPINDQYGHQAGDFVLKEAATRMREVLRDTDSIARLGGDEFAAILPSHGTRRQLSIIAQRVIASMQQPINYNGQVINISLSIGIAIHFKGQPLEALLHEADLAMYEAKRSKDVHFKYADELSTASV